MMDQVIPWGEWVGLIEPHYYNKTRGRRPVPIETMLRMYLLQVWFNLSDEAVEDQINDSYAMRQFMGLDFAVTQVPDATVAALISGSLVEPKELARARANVPNEIRTFAIRCDQASDPGFRRVGSMNVLTIAELGDLSKGAGNL